MNIRIKTILICFAFIGLTVSCASNKEPPPVAHKVEVVPAQLPSSADGESTSLVLSSLEDPNLPRGACGMVLWTLDINRPIPVLRYVAGDVGELRLNGIPYELIRLNVGGNSAFGVFPVQTFAAGTNIEVEVELQFGQGFDGGTYLERGIITIKEPDGSALITPIAGIAGCRSK